MQIHVYHTPVSATRTGAFSLGLRGLLNTNGTATRRTDLLNIRSTLQEIILFVVDMQHRQRMSVTLAGHNNYEKSAVIANTQASWMSQQRVTANVQQ